MTDEMKGYLIGGTIAIILLIGVSYYLYRWIFSINRQLWNQKQQLIILAKIARKIGIEDEEIGTIDKQNRQDYI